jgi:hypothetical protein
LRQLVKVGNGADQSSETGGGAGQSSGGGEVVLGDDAEREFRKNRERRVGILESFAVGTKAGDTSEGALRGLNFLGFAIQVQSVLGGEATRAGGGGQGTERALREGD